LEEIFTGHMLTHLFDLELVGPACVSEDASNLIIIKTKVLLPQA
jgi:hypothetical protein